MKQLEVQIMGQSYLLGCPEGGEQQLLDAVRRVDEAMCRIRDAGRIKARDRIAVLAALNLAFDAPAVATAATSANPASAADVASAAPTAPTAPAAPGMPQPAFAAASAATAPAGSAITDDAAADPRLAEVLQRLEQALGHDDRLL